MEGATAGTLWGRCGGDDVTEAERRRRVVVRQSPLVSVPHTAGVRNL